MERRVHAFGCRTDTELEAPWDPVLRVVILTVVANLTFRSRESR